VKRSLELVAQPRGRGLDALERRDSWLEGASALGCEAAGSSHTDSYEYRSAMTSLLNTAKHSKWRNVRPSSRTAMTQLADHVDQVDDRYNGLSGFDKLKWKNAETVAEHCPQHLVIKKGRNTGKG
jgi:hypothetical protein